MFSVLFFGSFIALCVSFAAACALILVMQHTEVLQLQWMQHTAVAPERARVFRLSAAINHENLAEAHARYKAEMRKNHHPQMLRSACQELASALFSDSAAQRYCTELLQQMAEKFPAFVPRKLLPVQHLAAASVTKAAQICFTFIPDVRVIFAIWALEQRITASILGEIHQGKYHHTCVNVNGALYALPKATEFAFREVCYWMRIPQRLKRTKRQLRNLELWYRRRKCRNPERGKVYKHLDDCYCASIELAHDTEVQGWYNPNDEAKAEADPMPPPMDANEMPPPSSGRLGAVYPPADSMSIDLSMLSFPDHTLSEYGGTGSAMNTPASFRSDARSTAVGSPRPPYQDPWQFEDMPLLPSCCDN